MYVRGKVEGGAGQAMMLGTVGSLANKRAAFLPGLSPFTSHSSHSSHSSCRKMLFIYHPKNPRVCMDRFMLWQEI